MRIVTPRPAEERSLQLSEVDDPVPAAGEIVIAVEACAVCRTDLQLAEGDLKARHLPITPGHQVVGRVAEVGPAVEGWHAGDVAGIGWLGGSCGHCGFCLSGRENLCYEATFTGWDREGGFAERIAVRADFALHLPAGLDAVHAAPLLCGGVIGYRSLLRSAVRRGGRLGLFGYGASAHLTIQVARHWGCEVYVFTRSQAERDRALATGAAWTGGYEDEPPALLDAAITFAPVGDVVIDALQRLERGGTVAINAIHLDRVPQFSYDWLWLERNLVSVANYTRRTRPSFSSSPPRSRCRPTSTSSL